jgi:hypothetical protein
MNRGEMESKLKLLKKKFPEHDMSVYMDIRTWRENAEYSFYSDKPIKGDKIHHFDTLKELRAFLKEL